MRVLLIHNPKAGDLKHGRKQLMQNLKRNGLQAFYHSVKERVWEKAFRKSVDVTPAPNAGARRYRSRFDYVFAERRKSVCGLDR